MQSYFLLRQETGSSGGMEESLTSCGWEGKRESPHDIIWSAQSCTAGTKADFHFYLALNCHKLSLTDLLMFLALMKIRNLQKNLNRTWCMYSSNLYLTQCSVMMWKSHKPREKSKLLKTSPIFLGKPNRKRDRVTWAVLPAATQWTFRAFSNVTSTSLL